MCLMSLSMNRGNKRKHFLIIANSCPVRVIQEPIVNQEIAARLAKQRIMEIRKGNNFKDTATSVFLKLGSRKRSCYGKKLEHKRTLSQLSLF